MRVTIQVDDGGVVTTDQPTTTSAPAPRGPEAAPTPDQPSAELAARAASSAGTSVAAAAANPGSVACTTVSVPSVRMMISMATPDPS